MPKQRRPKAETEVDIRTVPGAGRDLTPAERRGGGGGQAPPSQGGTQPEAGPPPPPPQGIEGP